MFDKSRLEEILKTMDLPASRVLSLDLMWLSRNLGIKNRHHPDFEEALGLILLGIKEKDL